MKEVEFFGRKNKLNLFWQHQSQKEKHTFTQTHIQQLIMTELQRWQRTNKKKN